MDGLYGEIPSRNGWFRGTPLSGNLHLWQSLQVQELCHRRHAEDPGDGAAKDLERAVLGDPGMRNLEDYGD